MGIDTSSTSSISAAASTQPASSSSSSKVSSSDTSFKEEMSKVSQSETKKESKTSDKDSKNIKSEKKNETKDKKLSVSKNEDERKIALSQDDANKRQNSVMLNSQLTMNDANMMLSNDIAQMVENTTSINEANLKNWSFGFGEDNTKSSLYMNETDADFFINLTQNDEVNLNGIAAQAQGMLNTGVETAEVKQNVQVSQALLSALSEAREKNQPLRIDFDQNVSVILRVGRDGAISAQFIPGDKVVEQYLRQNIDTLKSAFDEQELPYNDLSYSHSSKEQNQRRREEKRQGE